MISFECDYLEGCHEAILQALTATNLEQESGYGWDRFSASAKEKIRAACQCPDADIWFMTGGTQTNMVAISTMLEDCEGAVAADSGHINTHEAGAIEYTGHKVLPLPSHDGKVDPEEFRAYLEEFFADTHHNHMVFPGMLYISHPTELGTLYTARELESLSATCHDFQIKFYVDGARLGYGLMAKETDVTLPQLAKLCDAFYIGGTKVGALSGEALVFPRETPKHFLTKMRQRGAHAAKGRLIGIQFDTLFTDDLYFKISAHAIAMAQQLKQVFLDAGIPFDLDSPTNQQFVILENIVMEKLAKSVRFTIWAPLDADHTVVRFVTSWATQPENIQFLRNKLQEIVPS